MSETDSLLQNNERYAAGFSGGDLPAPPGRQVAVVACMDARLDVYRLLGLSPGEAHVIRNAGGVVTDEVVRSLAISQHKLGTREVVLIHHTKCGMEGLDEDAFAAQLDEAAGGAPRGWEVAAFTSADDSVRASIEKLRESPFLPEKGSIRGFVFDVETGRLREVDAE
jgi:carbonic anhydrase